MNDTRILLIEDEPDLRAGLQHNLELEGYSIDTAADGKQGLRKALQENPALILLDLMLPVLPGIEVLRQLRAAGHGTPVIILSAKGQDRDKVQGLELGADDYLTKPFTLSELTARIRAVLRRTQVRRPTIQVEEAAPVLQFQDLVIDFKRFTVTRDGQEIQLSRYEAEILRMLVDRRGEVVQGVEQRTVDTHIARLRKKVERDVDAPVHVVTVHGLGYCFESKPLAEGKP